MVYHNRVQEISIVLILFICLILFTLTIPAQNTQEDEQDSDSDGMPDSWEDSYGLDPNNSSDANEDQDSDELNNLMEFENGTNPNNNDTDAGGIDDGTELANGYDPKNASDDDEIDSDHDGMPDLWEMEYNLAPANPEDADDDYDGDGLTNLEEYEKNSNPFDRFDSKKKEDKDADGGAIAMNEPDSTLCLLIFIVPGIVVLLALIFIYTKVRRDRLLEHDTRKRIYQYINQNPGTHYREVMNELDLHMGTLTHHVNMLEQQRYIKSYQDGMYRRFYPIDAKIDTGLILTDIQKNILRAIHDNPGISQTGIAKELGLSRKIVHYHIKLLSDAGFVNVEAIGRETSCHYVGGLDLMGSTAAMGPQGPKPRAG